MTIRHIRHLLGLACLSILIALVACDRRGNEPTSATAEGVRIAANTAGSGVQLDSLNAIVRVVIEGERFARIDSTYPLVAGRYFEATLDLPVGEVLDVTLSVEEVVGINISVSPPDTTFRVVYMGSTSATVRPEEGFTINIDLFPVPPLVRLAPRFVDIPSGETFTLALEVHNIPGLALIDVVIDFGYFGDDLLLPINGIKGPSLGSSVDFSAGLANDDTEYEVLVVDTSQPTRPITDAGGFATLALIEFDSKQQAEKAANALTSVSLQVAQAIDFQANQLDIQSIATDQADISLRPATDSTVSFPDPALTEVVTRAIGANPPATLQLSQVLTLTYLESASDAVRIVDLTNIDVMQNLEEVYFQFQDFKELGPLGRIPSLTNITIYGGVVADVSPLANLPRVEFLDLGFNDITNIQPITAMSTVDILYLNNNLITSIAGLDKMRNLEWLYLQGNQITTITPLADLTRLRYLDLSDNQITSIATLVQNPGLGSGDTVDLTNNPLNSDAFQIHIPELERRGVNVIVGT